MSFTWPWALLALLAIPLVLLVALWSRRRRRRTAVRVTSAALVRVAMPGRSRWRRRIPAALLMVGIAVLSLGAARPQRSEAISANATTILLAVDVSGSMCSTDVSPNRITAAEKAAAAFIKAQPGGSRIGLVTFAGVAGLTVPPTRDTGKLLDALKDLTTSRGTAIGEAILTSIDAIAQVDPSVAPTGVTVDASKASGAYAADVIVVLTDGANNRGVDPATAAKEAAARRLRVYTIGFGTTTPAPLVCDSSQIGDGGGGFGGGFGGGGGGFGGGGGGGRDIPGRSLTIDEDALKQVASATGAHYYRAQNADQLQGALADLPRTITVTHKKVDIADEFAGVGGLLVATAVGLSLWWNRVRRLPTGQPGDGRPRSPRPDLFFSARVLRRVGGGPQPRRGRPRRRAARAR